MTQPTFTWNNNCEFVIAVEGYAVINRLSPWMTLRRVQ